MTYSDCMNKISKDDIFNGLLGFGLFPDRLPPFLTSLPYLNYAMRTPFPDKKYKSKEDVIPINIKQYESFEKESFESFNEACDEFYSSKVKNEITDIPHFGF